RAKGRHDPRRLGDGGELAPGLVRRRGGLGKLGLALGDLPPTQAKLAAARRKGTASRIPRGRGRCGAASALRLLQAPARRARLSRRTWTSRPQAVLLGVGEVAGARSPHALALLGWGHARTADLLRGKFQRRPQPR